MCHTSREILPIDFIAYPGLRSTSPLSIPEFSLLYSFRLFVCKPKKKFLFGRTLFDLYRIVLCCSTCCLIAVGIMRPIVRFLGCFCCYRTLFCWNDVPHWMNSGLYFCPRKLRSRYIRYLSLNTGVCWLHIFQPAKLCCLPDVRKSCKKYAFCRINAIFNGMCASYWLRVIVNNKRLLTVIHTKLKWLLVQKS